MNTPLSIYIEAVLRDPSLLIIFRTNLEIKKFCQFLSGWQLSINLFGAVQLIGIVKVRWLHGCQNTERVF